MAALAGWPAWRALAQDDPARPRQKVSAHQLQQALTDRFPVRFALGDLFELRASEPRLLLLPATQQVGATLTVQVSGSQLQPLPPGEVDVVFRLRYEAADRTLRARQLQIRDVRWPGLPADTLQIVQGVLPELMRNVGEVVLHRFSPRDLALADTMGFQPDQVTVVDDGLLVLFAAKPLR
jgi:hypothetical protein